MHDTLNFDPNLSSYTHAQPEEHLKISKVDKLGCAKVECKYRKYTALKNLQVFLYSYLYYRHRTAYHFVSNKCAKSPVHNTNVYKLRRAIYFPYPQHLATKFSNLLILRCSFHLWWKSLLLLNCLDLNLVYHGNCPLITSIHHEHFGHVAQDIIVMYIPINKGGIG